MVRLFFVCVCVVYLLACCLSFVHDFPAINQYYWSINQIYRTIIRRERMEERIKERMDEKKNNNTYNGNQNK